MVKGEAEAECTRASLLGRYEIGRTLGEGNFGKVKYARHIATGAHFAIKILDRSKILSLRINDQIRREIGTLKLLKHPNVVRLHEVAASKTKIYMVLEFVNGGELFDKIVSHRNRVADVCFSCTNQCHMFSNALFSPSAATLKGCKGETVRT
jgi:5'-AMP-activated protein kinase catalytic alpha subunit